MTRREPGKLVAARLGNAGGIVIGLGQGEAFVASDIPAILDYTQRLIFLEDRELAVVTAEGAAVTRLDGTPVEKLPAVVPWDPVSAAKGDYKHFMQKEIHEQPRSLTDALRGRVDVEGGAVLLDELRMSDAELWRLGRVYAVACGTAWHAALIGKYFLETLARVRVDVDYGSEFRYRKPILGEDTLLLAITQSGETVDTLAAMDCTPAPRSASPRPRRSPRWCWPSTCWRCGWPRRAARSKPARSAGTFRRCWSCRARSAGSWSVWRSTASWPSATTTPPTRCSWAGRSTTPWRWRAR
jgi:glucosamine--fructose-6-phosphate aminotransferase (isomerizing)